MIPSALKALCVLLVAHLVTTPSRSAAQSFTAAQIAQAKQRYVHEPTAAQVIDAAVCAANLSRDRTASIASRARHAGWIPRLSLGTRRGQNRDSSLLQAQTDDRINRSTDDQFVLEATLVFDFDRLMFAGQETDLLREERVRALDRQELIQMVTDLYYERRRLQLERDLLGRRDLSMHLRIEQLGALLNGLTHGRFYQQALRSQRANR